MKLSVIFATLVVGIALTSSRVTAQTVAKDEYGDIITESEVEGDGVKVEEDGKEKFDTNASPVAIDDGNHQALSDEDFENEGETKEIKPDDLESPDEALADQELRAAEAEAEPEGEVEEEVEGEMLTNDESFKDGDEGDADFEEGFIEGEEGSFNMDDEEDGLDEGETVEEAAEEMETPAPEEHENEGIASVKPATVDFENGRNMRA